MGGLALHGDDLLLLSHRQHLHGHSGLQDHGRGRSRRRPGGPPGQLLRHVRKPPTSVALVLYSTAIVEASQKPPEERVIFRSLMAGLMAGGAEAGIHPPGLELQISWNQ